jgi:hypothetical protein
MWFHSRAEFEKGNALMIEVKLAWIVQAGSIDAAV